MWEDVVILRMFMKDIGLKKIVGESFIEIGKFIYKFKFGEDFCVEYEGMYLLLIGLNLYMKIIDSEFNVWFVFF